MSSTISGSSSPLALSGLTGFDTSSVVNQLVQIESMPMQNLQSQESSIKNVQGLWNQYNSLLTAFKSASDALGNAQLYTGTKATSSNTSELTVTSDATAGTGTYNVKVLQMATAQVVQSSQQASNFVLTSNGSFSLNGVSVNLTAGMSLQQIASQINQTIGVGASASVVNNQMFLVNSQTGATGMSFSDPNGILFGLGITNVQSAPQTSGFTLANGGTFQLNGATVSVNTGATLQDIATQINNTSGVGVNASVFNNQLILGSTQTGAAGTTFSDPNNILSGLGIVTGSNLNEQLVVQTAGQDAYVNVFGQTVHQSSNTFTNVINGVTFTINSSPTNTPVTPYSSSNPPSSTTAGDQLTINVASDSSALTTALNNYVTAFNNIHSFVQTNTAVNSGDSTKSGALLGNTSLMNFQNMLISAVTNPVSLTSNASSVYNALSSFGITYQTDGTLKIDTTTETNAIQGHLADLQSLFTQPNSGLVAQMDTLMNTLQNPANGFVTTIVNGYTTQISSLDSQISNWQTQIAQYQKSLTQQFTQMQITMQKLQSQGTSMMNMMSGMMSSSSTTG